MTIEDQLREGFRQPVLPDLTPPAGLADTVLRRLRQRRITAVAAVVAFVAFAAVGVPLRGTIAVVAGWAPDPDFPRPGGGPVAVLAYRAGETTYLLDPETGRYQPFRLRVRLSPDQRYAAVAAGDGRVGIVERAALLRRGEEAVHWLAELGDQPEWALDGSAFVYAAISKDSSRVAFSAVRYDVRTGEVATTPIPVDILGSRIGWAPDSRRYLVLVRGSTSGDTVEPDGMRVVDPSGALGERFAADGMPPGAQMYAPAGDRFAADVAEIMSGQALRSPVVDARTGAVMANLPERTKPIGWYGDQTVLALAPGWQQALTLLFVNAQSGQILRTLPLHGVTGVDEIQVGTVAEMSESARAYGF